MDLLITSITKAISSTSKTLGIGHGSTWPGHIALKLNKNVIKNILRRSDCKVILVAGTNGKTTTAKMIETILSNSGHKVFHNESGANLLSGITSSIILSTSSSGKLEKDFAVFEVDEASLPLVLKEVTPDILVVLNLFRDQLDRYGELNTVFEKWQKALGKLSSRTTLVLNADDPRISYLGSSSGKNSFFFGLDEKLPEREGAKDSAYCPKCGKSLDFSKITFSHLGVWKCMNCGLKRSKPNLDKLASYPLQGSYNKYNSIAAVLTARIVGVENPESYLKDFKPAFGRQEEIKYSGKSFKLFLSKNPTSFNQSLETIMQYKPKSLLFILNDRVPDGRDVSWIWDTDIERYSFSDCEVLVSGDRVYDMAVRLKYGMGNETARLFEDLSGAINASLKAEAETIYVLPTYSAMLDVRKILRGKKIL